MATPKIMKCSYCAAYLETLDFHIHVGISTALAEDSDILANRVRTYYMCSTACYFHWTNEKLAYLRELEWKQ